MIQTRNHKKSIESAAVHAGKKKRDQYGAHVSPIYQTSTYVFADVESGARAFSHEVGGASHIYSRISNPTVEELERGICELETHGIPKTEIYQGMAFGSGMAAITSGIMGIAKGRHVIAQDALYGCTSQFLNEEAPAFGMSVSFVDTSDLFMVEMELKKHTDAALIYLESIANPTLSLSDIPAIAELASRYNVKLMVDNTFATPYHMQPLALGADVVVHSTTKYLGGHGTIIGGAIIARQALMEEYNLQVLRKNLGGIAGPMDAWLTSNGLKTLPLRMKQHAGNAMQVANFLEHHPRVNKVFYPGLESHPQHQLASHIMNRGFGGMISFELEDGYSGGLSLMNRVKLCTLAVSLGAVDTLIQHPASMTHSVVDPEIKEKAGITDGLVRLSVGIEAAEDIITDLEQALEFVN